MKRSMLIECINVERERLLELVRKNGYEPLSQVDENGREYILCTKGKETHIIHLSKNAE